MFSARAAASSELIETLPLPLSTSARKRSDRPESAASCLRVMPRRARQARTRAPSSARVARASLSVMICMSSVFFAEGLRCDQDCSILPVNAHVKQFIAYRRPSMKLKILVGTMTSTADYVAQAIQMDCADLVDEIEVLLMDGLDISVFDEDALYLICTSTYGSGDVPDNARAAVRLARRAAQVPGPRALRRDRAGRPHLCADLLLSAARSSTSACKAWARSASAKSGAMTPAPARCPEELGTAWCREWLVQRWRADAPLTHGHPLQGWTRHPDDKTRRPCT